MEVLVGSALVREGEGFANRSVLIRADGAIAATYDKIHMFDVDLPARDGHPAESARREGDSDEGFADREGGGLAVEGSVGAGVSD